MKAFVVLAIIGAVAAAPADKDQILRTKKSAYGAAPCAGGAPLSPIALYLSPGPQAGYGGGAISSPHYRADEHKEEDKEQARSYYESGIAAAAAGSAIAAPASSIASSGGAVGLFPHAKVGGCAVPLLLSCSPSVVSGHIAHGPSYAAHAGYGAYRAPEDSHKEMKMDHAAGEKWATGATAERAPADLQNLHDLHSEHPQFQNQNTLAGNFLDHHEHHNVV